MPGRVALIAGIDSQGSTYMALSTGNTDSDVMVTFFSHLIALLDLEESNWRDRTIILLDNAKYHHSITTENAMKRFGLRVIFSGPYAYTSAPVETFFSHLKSGELNPLKLQLGKR